MDTNEINRIKNSTPFFIIHPEDGSYIEIKTIDDVTRRFFYYTKNGTRYKIKSRNLAIFSSIQEIEMYKLKYLEAEYKNNKDKVYEKYKKYRQFEKEHPELCI